MINSKRTVCILNYGAGNVQSVYNLTSSIAQNVIVSSDPQEITAATHLILPGVGSFGDVMQKIRNNLHVDVLQELVVVKKRPILGICVGMQVFADIGTEFGRHSGLGWIAGEVNQLDSGAFPLPHVGWNDIDYENEHPLLSDLKEVRDFYFVHKYAFTPLDTKAVLATTDYGQKFCSVIGNDNILGVQFHPEKSQLAGRKLISNFLKI